MNVVIRNEQDMFNHLFSASQQKAVEVEPKEEFLRGIQALRQEGALFHVKLETHFGGRLLVFSKGFNRVGIMVEDTQDGKVRLTYEVLEDFDAKFK